MILFFWGEETYQSSQKVLQWKKEFLKKNPTGGGMVIFDCDETCDIFHIIQSLGEQNLFAQKKLIIVENLFAHTKAPEQKQLQEVLRQETEDVIIFFERGNVRKNAALFKWLIKNAHTTFESKLLSEYELSQWIIKKIKNAHTTIAHDAVQELILFVGNDLWKLTQEIEKLICYANGDEIDVMAVRDIVHGRVDADMFQTVEAIATDNKSEALTLLRKQRASGDAAFHIFGMYVYQIRTLLTVSGLVHDGVMDKYMIAEILKIHPFVAQKSLGMINNMSHEKIMMMHKKITILDGDVKRGNRDIESALDLFVVGA